MELGARVAEALLARAKSTEVLDRLWNDVVEQLEVDTSLLVCTATMLAIEFYKLQKWLSDGIAVGRDGLTELRRSTRSLPFTSPVEVTLPLESTWISGPVQVTSK